MPLVSSVGGAALGSSPREVFVRVNQVLVRLWACLLACLTGCVAPQGVASSEQVARSDDDCCVLSESDPFVRDHSRFRRLAAGDLLDRRLVTVER
jgi:hypothetical protein